MKWKRTNTNLICLLLFAILIHTNCQIFRYTQNLSEFNEEVGSDIKLDTKSSRGNFNWYQYYASPVGDQDFVGNDVWTDDEYVYTVGTNTQSFLNRMILIKWSILDGSFAWARTFESTENSEGYAICGDVDYIYTAGSYVNETTYGIDMLVVKWDKTGNQIWNRTYDENGFFDQAFGIYRSPSGVTVTGPVEVSESYLKLALVNFMENGAIGGVAYSGTLFQEIPRELCRFDGGTLETIFMFTCGTRSGMTGNQAFIYRMDIYSSWLEQDWGAGSTSDEFNDLWTDNTNIYTVGSTESYGVGNTDLVICKWDQDLNLIWNKTWGTTEYDYGTSIIGSGSFLYTVGYVKDTPSSDDAYSVISKWDIDGNLVWTRTYDQFDYTVLNGVSFYNDYVISVGTRDWEDLNSSTYYGQIITKWETGNEYLTIDLSSPVEGNAYVDSTEISVDIVSSSELDSVYYSWDNPTPSTLWNPPYTTTLPPIDGAHTLYIKGESVSPYVTFSTSEFDFITDNTAPIVVIQSPIIEESYSSPPTYDIEITEANPGLMWYTLNDGSNHYITEFTGEINATAWKDLPRGEVSITFYSNDAASNVGSNEVVIKKQFYPFWSQWWFYGAIGIGTAVTVIPAVASMKKRKFKKARKLVKEMINTYELKRDVKLMVSYTHEDDAIFHVSDLVITLEKYPNISEVVYSQRDTRADFLDYMNQQIKESDGIILLCSKNIEKSKYVKMEWSAAEVLDKPIIPVFMNKSHIPPVLASRLGTEFYEDKIPESTEGIYAIIKKILGEPIKNKGN